MTWKDSRLVNCVGGVIILTNYLTWTRPFCQVLGGDTWDDFHLPNLDAPLEVRING